MTSGAGAVQAPSRARAASSDGAVAATGLPRVRGEDELAGVDASADLELRAIIDMRTATCNANCTLPVCGDGHRNAAANEPCDDGNFDDSDGCTFQCMMN